jgi:GT2 family glycosyltransferase
MPSLTAQAVASIRASLIGLAYGDQGFFVRRPIFTALGGFRELPLMEDVDFVRRLHHGGRIVPSPLEICTSARRWHRDGWFRRSTANLGLLALYFAGVAPTRLAHWYKRS